MEITNYMYIYSRNLIDVVVEARDSDSNHGAKLLINLVNNHNTGEFNDKKVCYLGNNVSNITS